MSRILTISALLLAAGCTKPAEQTAETVNNVTADAAAEPKPADVPLLKGEWQLTELDGRPIDGSALIATFGDGTVRVAAGCLRRAWSFTQQRNIVSFAAQPGSANCGSPPTADQDGAFHALDRATMAIFAKQGSEASLSGNGGNVTLVRR